MSELRQRKKEDKQPRVEEKNEEVKKTPMEIAQEKYRKFFTRTIWGSFMITGFAGILYSNHYLVCLFVVVLQCIVFKEMIGLRYIEAKEKQLWGFRTLHWYFLLVTFFYVYGSPVFHQLSRILSFKTLDLCYRYHLVIAFTLYVIGFIAFIVTLKRDTIKYQFGQLTWTLMTLLVVVGQSNFIIQNIFKGLFWLVFPCSLIICNDIMAYFCGLLFGRRFVDKPLTSLSPNKTWEGFVGALFCTLIFAFVSAGLLSNIQWFICPKETAMGETFLYNLNCEPDPVFLDTEYSIPALAQYALRLLGLNIASITLKPIQLHALVFALFSSLIAPFGGFFASGIKRAYHIKDFDSLFPGHGGMTDRMDCQFIMGLFTYVYYTSFISRATMTASQLLYNISHLPVNEQLSLFRQLNTTLAQYL